ncbi:tail fiber domain-containing protein [Dyadobacter sandarakinus]|uniref:Tail fiber domain-containing protein n=1 Tax=Dyadobacter sandarakinus TaxID=2747268 RepID=A0ABX7ICG8_9BACT|nr:tail fiber domain-containing protein [Dyadobacter sandarakinus]QRR03819.1 tail fiber domain-containing protein [Dyadobacter sandarakinus]
MPNRFSYQGIARGADGKIIQNASVKLRLTIYEKLSAEPQPTTKVFEETQSVMTNDFGVFNVAIGSVTPGLDVIDWAALDKTFFLGIKFDPLGGEAFVDLGTTQLLSVPYAMLSRQADALSNNKPLILKGAYGTNEPPAPLPSPAIGEGERLIWHPGKAAFRAGFQTSSLWYNANIGNCSFATGYQTNAYGDYSTAMGYESSALGLQTVAIGRHSEAIGDSSFAFGLGSKSVGNESIALGNHVTSKSVGSVVVGSYNDDSEEAKNIPFFNDRVFQVGIGNYNNRKNAMTILYGGNVGIGTNVLAPEYLLDLGARARVRHNAGATAGIHFNNSQNNVDGFVGMRADGEVGFFVGNIWAFWVNGQGEGRLNGSMIQTSDRRLKKDITLLPGSSLSKLSKINGYFFRWNDGRTDQSIQTGLIAQEVENLFPELVKTDEKGFKSVNYIGMIPHLIESVKELKSKTDKIAILRKELEMMKALSQKIEKLEAAMSQSVGAPSKITGR